MKYDEAKIEICNLINKVQQLERTIATLTDLYEGSQQREQ
jgi:hypothetical protein